MLLSVQWLVYCICRVSAKDVSKGGRAPCRNKVVQTRGLHHIRWLLEIDWGRGASTCKGHVDLLAQLGHVTPELLISAQFAGDLLHAMGNRRVVAPAEHLANLRQ